MRPKNPFPAIKNVRGVVWHKVKNEKHRDSLDEKVVEFKHFSDEGFRFGFSFHLYYKKKTFKLTPQDLKIIAELDEMLEWFLGMPTDQREIEISRQLGPAQQSARPS